MIARLIARFRRRKPESFDQILANSVEAWHNRIRNAGGPP